jgi:predicted GIY-YIG superfamily endonuclease
MATRCGHALFLPKNAKTLKKFLTNETESIIFIYKESATNTSHERKGRTMIYLLHFSHAYHHAQHYLGYADNVDRRVAEHLQGTGARLTQVVLNVGITFKVVRTWEGGRDKERTLKNQKNGRRLCPVCRGKGTIQ